MIDKIEISALKDYLETNDESEPKIASGFLEDVILMFEEINRYRAIGAVEQLKDMKQNYAEALSDWRQYRKIGTVEECRESREMQRGKKPEHFYKKYGKHQWRRKDNGEIDEDAWDSDTHSGVICEVCGECVCTMCNPDYDELDDCEEEYWICPNCAKKIYCKDKYCQCGQHLDWSDTP